MKKTVWAWALFSTLLQAENIGGFVRLQYDYLDFSHSKQKEEGQRVTGHLKLGGGPHTFQAAYEKTATQTCQPPLKEDLDVDKFIGRYDFSFSKQDRVTFNVIAVEDNLVPTDGGRVVGAGWFHRFTPQVAAEINGYYGRYDIMETYQLDTTLKLHHTFGAVDTTIILVAKKIFIEECSSVFCAKADPSYLTAGAKVKLGYRDYFLHAGAFAGKRVFAVMMEGFVLQHHAMEFDRTWMAGVGRRFGDVELKLRYISQRARELPLSNPGVTVDTASLRLAWFF